MRFPHVLAIVLLHLALGSPLRAEPVAAGAGAEVLPGLQITGFGDVCRVSGASTQAPTRYMLGQVEVDLETDVEEHVGVAAAIAYDGETFGLGAFTIDFRLLGGDEAWSQPAAGVHRAGILVGQFDVPFGIDWHVYPSIDRALVSAPLAVEQAHDFWNDQGVQLYLETERLDAAAYVTNGFGYESHGSEVPMEMALGARAGLRLLADVELGASWAGFVDDADAVDMQLVGADLTLDRGATQLKGEAIARFTGTAGHAATRDLGGYLQVRRDLGELYLVARAGRFDPEGGAAEERLSAGVGWALGDACALRLEHQANRYAKNLSLMQAVVAF